MTTPTNAPESANKPCDVCSRPIGNRVFTICDDCWPTHRPAASTPAAPQPATEGMTFDEWWERERAPLILSPTTRRHEKEISRVAWTAAKGGRS